MLNCLLPSSRKLGFTRCASTLLTLSYLCRPSLAFFLGTVQVTLASQYRLHSETSSHMTSKTEVAQFPCLSDNYGYLIHCEETNETAAIDTPDAKVYKKVLDSKGWKLSHIINTHHHFDHTGGNLELKRDGVKIYGPLKEKEKIPGIDITLTEGDTVPFGGKEIHVLDVGGHTDGHIALYFKDDGMVFVGDALFALGCGKMFEGTPMQFWTSLLKLRALPEDTLVYCAHEYTLSNAKFALSVEPSNKVLAERFKAIQAAREAGIPTIPTTIGDERATNPFLRCDTSQEIRSNVGVASENEFGAIAFAKVRQAKDNFRA